MTGDATERTADGRYIVVDGRKWRATDPSIPAQFEKELVAELMTARRLVKAKAEGARDRVQDAKVALGERGEPWWETATTEGRSERLAASIRALLWHRDADSTICPSDAARVVGGSSWRPAVSTARDVATSLRAQGIVRITQRGEDVDPAEVTGPIRIARGPNWPIDGGPS